MTDSLLAVENISKRFAGVHALDGVSFSVQPGEAVAVIGENGAGKSTLMKILAGVQPHDSGAMLLDGKPVAFRNCREALDAGVVLIHQELNLAGNLDIGANLYLGREPRIGPFVSQRTICRQTQTYLDRIGLDASPRQLVGELSIGRQQMVEIAKALSANARVLIMDEPTSSLSLHETEQLFRVVHQLRHEGVSIIYISHRLGEVKELCDRVVVLRDGKNAGELQRDEITHDAMVRLMVGRDVSQVYQRTEVPVGECLLQVKQLATSAWPRHRNSFEIRTGEIVGIAGLVGAGRSELLQVLFGIDPAASGSIWMHGKPVNIESARDAIELGIALVPEDRKQHGVLLDMPVGDNVALASLKRFARIGGFVNDARAEADAEQAIRTLRIRTPSASVIAKNLSGGNQQKVVIGKWLALEPKLLLLDEPTRGIDVGAKQEIYQLMEQLARQGMAVLFVSSEMEEVLGMSDRVLVMHEGRITGELSAEQMSEEAIMSLATAAEPSVESPASNSSPSTQSPSANQSSQRTAPSQTSSHKGAAASDTPQANKEIG